MGILKDLHRIGKLAAVMLIVSMALMNNAAAAEEISFFDWMPEDNPLNALGDSQPIVLAIVGFFVAAFLFSALIGVFGSGTKANLGAALHKVEARKQGVNGVVTVVGVVVLVIISLVMMFYMYNKYLIGA